MVVTSSRLPLLDAHLLGKRSALRREMRMHKEDGHRDEVLHSNSKRLKPEPSYFRLFWTTGSFISPCGC